MRDEETGREFERIAEAPMQHERQGDEVLRWLSVSKTVPADLGVDGDHDEGRAATLDRSVQR